MNDSGLKDPRDDWNSLFNPREQRALLALGIQSADDFIDCDLTRIFDLFYIGKNTYFSLLKKQKIAAGRLQKSQSAPPFINPNFNFKNISGSLGQLGLNPKEIEAFHSVGVNSVDEFLRCDPECINSFPGIGKTKLKRLKKLQDEKLQQEALLNFGCGGSVHNPLNSPVSSFDWNTRELNAIKNSGIESLLDFFNFDATKFRTINRVGRKTSSGLIEKQKKLFLDYFSSLSAPYETTDQTLISCDFIPNNIKEFLISIGMKTIQEFQSSNLRILQKSSTLPVTFTDLKNVQTNLPVTPPKSSPLYSIWENNAAEITLETMPFFSGYFIRGFSYTRLHSSFLGETDLASLPFDKNFHRLLENCGLKRLGDLLLVPRVFFEQLPVGLQENTMTAKNILKEYILNNLHRYFEPDWQTPESFTSSLTLYLTQTLKKNNRWVQIHIDKPRQNQILIDRANGLTLDEIGRKFNITRERIRQIELSIWRYLSSSQSHLEKIRARLEANLIERGGFVKISSLCKDISKVNNWPVNDVIYYFVHFFEIFKNSFNLYNGSYVSLVNFRCTECPAFLDAVEERMQDLEKNNETCNIENLIDYTRAKSLKLCKSCPCSCVKKFLPHELFSFLFENNSRFIPYRKRKILRLNYKLGLFESIVLALKNAGRPLTKKEILAEIRKLNPNLKITEKQIKTTAGNSLQYTREILLWNRGGLNSESMYVHQDYVKIDAPVLDLIEKDLLERSHRAKVPQMRLNHIFHEFKDQCIEQGIPNVYALFACLKRRANPNFTCQRSPYVGLVGHSQKVSNTQLLEDYVRSCGGSVSSYDLKNFGKSLGLRNEHIQNTITLTNLIAAQDGYVLLDRFDPASEGFHQLLDQVEKTLENNDYMTVTELYSIHKVQCEMLEISDARMFYHLLKRFSEKRFSLGFPVVSRGSNIAPGKLKKKVARRIVRHIKKQRRPVSSRDLIHFFCNKIGFPLSSIYKVISGTNIQLYGNAKYIHVATLRLNSQKKSQFQDLFDEYWMHCLQEKKPFGSILEFLDLFRTKLPELAPHFTWNRFLIYSLLIKSKKYIFWGNSKNIFVAVGNDSTPQYTLGTVLCYLLKKHFGGKTSVRQFSRFLAKDLKMIRRDLNSFLSENLPEIHSDGHYIEAIQ